MPMRAVVTELSDQSEFMTARFMELVDDRMVILEHMQELARASRFHEISMAQGEKIDAEMASMLGGIRALANAVRACQVKAREAPHPEVVAALV